MSNFYIFTIIALLCDIRSDVSDSQLVSVWFSVFGLVAWFFAGYSGFMEWVDCDEKGERQ